MVDLRRNIHIGWLAAAFWLTFLSSWSAWARSLGEEIEHAIGRATLGAVKGSLGVIEGGLLDAWVKGETAQLARSFPGWKFQVYLVSSAEPNAFSAPGGFIFVTWGLMEEIESDDELAGVLAHEMAHSAEHHVAEVVGKQFVLSQLLNTLKSKRYRWIREAGSWGLVLLALSDMRRCEKEADAIAVRACLEAGYDPEGLALLLGRISGNGPKGLSEVFATHPPTSKRVSRIRTLTEEKAAPEVLCQVGWAMLKRGRVRKAREFFQQALERSKSCREAAKGLVSCLLRVGRPFQARAEAAKFGLSEEEFSKLEERFLPKPLEVSSVPPEGVKQEKLGPECQVPIPARVEEAAKEARRLVSDLSQSIVGHQAALQAATWRAKVDWAWIVAYAEAVGLAAAFREALFSVDCAVRWVEKTAIEGRGESQEAANALRKAADFLERAHRAIRPNILSLVLSSLSKGGISRAQLAMLQTTFFAAQKRLSRCVKEAERAIEVAGKNKVALLEERLGKEFISLPPRARVLALDLAVRRVGGNEKELRHLVEQGLPFGTVCLLMAISAESGERLERLASALGPKQSAVSLLESQRVYAPDVAIVLKMLCRDMEEIRLPGGSAIVETRS